MDTLQSLAIWSGDQLVDALTYPLPGTACDQVVQSASACIYPSNVQHYFPDASLLRQIGAEGYAGVPLLNANQDVLGTLCIIDTKPLHIDDRTNVLLTVFAARAATELQRQWAEDEKRRAYEELEFRVEERTSELVQTNLALEAEIRERIAVQTQLQQAAEREQATALVIQRMRQSLDLNAIFGTTTAELRQVIQCDRTLIYRFNSDWSGQVVAESVASAWNPIVPMSADGQLLTERVVDGANCMIKGLDGANVLIQDTYLQEHQGEFYRFPATYCCVTDIYQQDYDPCYLNLLEALQ